MRCPGPENMLVTRLNIIQNVPTIPETEIKGKQLLIDQGMDYEINLMNTKDRNIKFMLNKAHYKLFTIYTDQMFILRNYHEVISNKISTFNEAEIVYNSLKQ